MTHSRIIACCTLLAINLVAVTARGDEADTFFTAEEVATINLEFDDPNWYETLFTSHRNDPEDPYFPARFEYQGMVLDPVGVRFKGNSSFGIPGVKKSFKIDFNEYDEGVPDAEDTTFFGLKKLNLNNGFKDPTLMRSKLFLDFIGQFGPALRATHVRVHVNGEYWGLYTAVEQIDKTFIQRCFGDNEDGNLFEGESSGNDPQSAFGSDLSYLGPDPEDYYGRYELKTNEEENDWSQLVEFIDILNNTPSADLPEALEPVFDVDAWLLALAQDMLFVNLDSYLGSAHNYYLYDRDDTGLFTYLHWDTNETFGSFRYGVAPGQDLLQLGLFWLPEAAGPGNADNPRPLMENLWSVPEYRTGYLRALAMMLRSGFDGESFAERITECADRIRPHVYEDANKPYTNNDFEAGLVEDVGNGRDQLYGLRHFVEARATFLDPVLDAEAQPSDLRLNELMSLNLSSLSDDRGDHDPWLEIINLGPGRLALDQLSLSDDSNEPGVWPLPKRELDDGQYIVLFLDGETAEGALHSSIELDPNGGQLVLWAEGKIVDQLNYPPLAADQSWIRLPDGEGSWSGSDRPTPGAANTGSSAAPAIFINEVMAENDSTIADPASFDAYPDWFELYNAESVSVDLGGMYLSDDPATPRKWQIPEGVSIAAGEYLLFWADNDEPQGPTHAGFKLSSNGESLGLYDTDANDNRIVDEIAFPALGSDQSYGREVDGGPSLSILGRPTPGASNATAPRNPSGRASS